MKNTINPTVGTFTGQCREILAEYALVASFATAVVASLTPLI